MDSDDIHTHCFNCIKLSKCTIVPTPGISCEIIKCELDCGTKFHACKKKEHLLLCPNVKVRCINAENGCPLFMLRKRQSKHLHSCPASVIHCSAEWNRCPIHVLEKKVTESANFHKAMQYDLDVALAMRDRRMLHRWCDAVRAGSTPPVNKFRISPSNFYWIYKERQSSRESNRCENPVISTPWEIAPPGLEQSVCNELCRNSSHTHFPMGSVSTHRHSSVDKLIGGDMIVEVNCSCNKENNTDPTSSDVENMICDSCFSTKNNTKPESMPNYTLEDVLRLSDCDSMFVYDELPRKGSASFTFNSNTKGAGILTSTCVHPQNPATQISYFKFKNPTSTPPWCVPLGLDLNIESRMLFQTSNFMYTFLCCQEFRRDEYAWHYMNVHCEIHSGLNGWLQERCPLAQYGCKFARKRFNPAPEKSVIVYNEILDSFGVASNLTPQISENNMDTVNGFHTRPDIIFEDYLRRPKNGEELRLTHLPFEIVRYITTFLDSFSLSNLSLTCSLLRMVCASHLEDRGLVLLKWKKEKKDNRSTWKVDGRRWFFSSHFTPIHKWSFDDSNNMSNHLKSCSFFNRINHRYRSGIHHGSDDGLHQYELSISADDEVAKSGFEHTTTKL